ncbi:MAG: deoxyhypusine synthase [bacterium (Candidatus Ratteibacteria) CG_4_9_14_3_um_filter_41_21]|uniref:Deoxyhypusine synthase n=2 Tax=Candidatus Ratteibacteria TaxID=2979319 RepID=A0A2M7EAE7_9BACT|nr:MAG: deoxyhypusine synthase [bacterium (Candidatus Ratteibacteria) CG01_land_8_20_14_3_00_40_19]PJA62513.1 MAG: deoxyhypusine synthase [bacterium (Candidatus Ratteibacteria) CG_4_9_14_3_um_filter_41_21]
MKNKKEDGRSKLEKVYFKGLSRKKQAQKKKILSHPIEAIDLARTVRLVDLVDSFKKMSIQARRIGRCATVYENMLEDPKRPTIFLGLAGPLIAAGLRKVIRDMIEFNIIDVIVSTGAILYHDLYQSFGYKHYIGSPEADDSYLRELFIDRIYDTYVDDEKFIKSDSWVGRFADSLEPRSYSSREFLYLLGKEIKDENSILKTAAKYGVPVFSPALNDSSIGIGLTDHYHLQKQKKGPRIIIDAIRDNYELTQIVVKSKKTAAIYVAGGVPKNFINDSVVMSYIFGKNIGGHSYAFQVTTDVPHWGGLSGSTLEEAKSWGKVSKNATEAMAFVEPSVSLPLIVGYILQKKLRPRKRLIHQWENDILKEMRT